VNCRDLERWLDEGSPAADAAAARLHAAGCARCAEVLEIAASIEAAFRAEAADIPAPADFADRVMALVEATAIEPLAPRLAPEPRRVPAWMALASDPVTAVGITLALLLALAASWWPGHLLRGTIVAGAWAWDRAAVFGTSLDPVILLSAVILGAALAAFLVWRLWHAAERALILAITARRSRF
jgi:hypothetical protein